MVLTPPRLPPLPPFVRHFPPLKSQGAFFLLPFFPDTAFFSSPPVFFNNFIVVNPNLTSFCPNILTVGNPALGTPGIVPPVIQFPIFPSGTGTCQIPLNLGTNGITTLEWTYHGTHTGDIPGFPAKGEPIHRGVGEGR